VQAAKQHASADTPESVLAALHLTESGLAVHARSYKEALAAGERALACYRELADPRGIALAVTAVGQAQVCLGQISEGETLTAQAVQTARTLGAQKSLSIATEYLAFARHFVGDLPGARQRYGEALEGALSVGAERLAANTALSLAELEFQCGDAATALRLVDEALPLLRAFGETINLATALYNMAAYFVALRRFDEARTAAREAVAAARDAEFTHGLTFTLQHLAAIAALRPNADAAGIEDRSRAARILGYVDARLVALEALRHYTEQQEYDAMLPVLRDALSADQFAQLAAEGSAWSEDQAVAEAMLI
jgi:tetratricopeptide (TPR) repeat protein